MSFIIIIIIIIIMSMHLQLKGLSGEERELAMKSVRKNFPLSIELYFSSHNL